MSREQEQTARRTVLKGCAATAVGIGALSGTGAAQGSGDENRSPRLELVGHSTLGAPDGNITNMDVREDLGLAATGSFVFGDTDVHIADVSDLQNPEHVATTSAGIGYVNDVFFHPEEPWIFTANEGGEDAGWAVVDVDDPAEPELYGPFTVDDGAGVHTVIAFDEEHVIVSGTGRGIVIYDVTDPENPREVGEFQATDHSVESLSPDDPGHTHPSGYVHDTQVRGDYAYLAHWDHGLYIVDLSDPANPVEAASFDYQEETADVPLRNAHHAFPHPEDDICLVGEEVGSGNPGYKHVIEFDLDTGKTELLSSFRPPQGSAQQPTGQQGFWWTGHFSDWGVGDQQDVLFSGDYKAGVQTFDLSDPANPERIDQYVTTDGADEVRRKDPARAIDDIPMVWGANTKDSEYVYVSDASTGLFVFTLEGY